MNIILYKLKKNKKCSCVCVCMNFLSYELKIIQDALVKVEPKICRDFLEIENLQNSFRDLSIFVDKTIFFVKKEISDFLKFKNPYCDIFFFDESFKKNNTNSNTRYLVYPIYEKFNFIHAVPYFSILVSLQKKNKNNVFETIGGIIDSPILKETFFVQKGDGSFSNTRRIRVSNRNNFADMMLSIEKTNNKTFLKNCIDKYPNVQITNSSILNICNVATGKFDFTIIEKQEEYLELPILLVEEAGGFKKKIDKNNFLICNKYVYDKI